MDRTMDLTPSPIGYKLALTLVAKYSEVEADRVWASQELARVRGVTQWGPQS